MDRHRCQRCSEDNGPGARQLFRSRWTEKRLRPVPVRGRPGAPHRRVGQSLHHQRIRRPPLREDQVQRSAARAGYRSIHCAARSPGRLVARDAGRLVPIPGHSRNPAGGTGHARRPLCRDRGAAKRRVVPALRGPPGRHLADRPGAGSGQACSLASWVRRLHAIRGSGGTRRPPVRLDGLASGDRRGSARRAVLRVPGCRPVRLS